MPGPWSDRWRFVGFAVPAAIALAFSVGAAAWGIAMERDNGYWALTFVAADVFGVPAILAWLGLGALVARVRGPPGAAKAFATGAAAGLGAALLLVNGACWLTLAAGA